MKYIHTASFIALLCAITISTACTVSAQTKTKEILDYEKRLVLIHNKVIQTEAQIEEKIDKIVALLAQSQDTTSSKSRVQFNKEKTIDALSKSIQQYEQKRNMKLAELQSGSGYLSVDDLASDVTQLDEKIDKRIDQIIELVGSFTKSEGFCQYHESYKDIGGNRYLKTQSANPDYQHNKQVTQRADQKTKEVLSEMDTAITHLEQKNVELNDRLQRTVNDTQRQAIIEEITRNNQTIQTRRQQAVTIETGENAKPGENALTRKEAHNQELQIRALAAEIKTEYNHLSMLDAEYDRQRIILNGLYKTHGITEP